MSVGKQRLLILGLGLLAAAVAVNAGSMHSGSRQPKDRLVCVGRVDIRSQYNQVVSAQRVCNVPGVSDTITHILALDRGINGKGGYAQIIKGGLYQRNVTLYLWSQRSQPLNFTLEVYAKPAW